MSPSPAQRLQQARRLLRTEGPRGVGARVVGRASRWLTPPGQGGIPVRREDLLRAAEIAAGGWALPAPLDAAPGEPLTIAWVCGPAGAGSGGHTTMFRLVAALEQAGHRCILYLDDQHGWALEQHVETLRSWWPWMHAEVRDLKDGIEDAHAIFATSWETAYAVLASPARGKRFYLVQDFEPSFYPAGSEALMAEATYSFGFHAITAGRWLAEKLNRDYGARADHFDFGSDAEYSLDASDPAARTGICFYCRPETPRRAFELGSLALDLFAARHPDVDIHFFGRVARAVPYRVINHGLLSPAELNALYNRCVAGLVISATNVSLVPHEMLASGCLPVVNDAEHNRVVLDNDEVVYSAATPFALAETLSQLVGRTLQERTAAAASAASSVRGTTWAEAGAVVERTVRLSVADALMVRA